MSTTVLGIPEDHFRSLTVTTLASLSGLAAALVSSAVVSDPTSMTGLYVVGGFILIQYPVLQALGIDVEEFGAKDHLYVAFMAFSMWFVVWSILLTAGASL
ncbi:MAG: hypothetical protein V5A23_09855 [Halobacteriales archaeon]